MANGDILSDFGINLLEEEIDDVIFQTNEFLTDATFTGAQGPFWWILQMCMALAALFSIVMAAGIAYKMMVKHEPLDVMKLFRPLAVSIIICWWYPPADTGMAGSRNNWCFLDFLSYIPNCIGSYTHDLYEAEASQISDRFEEVQQLIHVRDTMYTNLQAQADVAHTGTSDPNLIEATMEQTGVDEVTNMEKDAAKLWFTSLTAGVIVGIDKIIMLIALVVFRIGWWATMYDFLFERQERNRPDHALPAVKTDLKALDPKENLLVWFGHSSYLIQADGLRILVDPVFETASPLPFFNRPFEGTDLYKPEDMPGIDLLVITHDHWDHLDYGTVTKLRDRTGRVVCPLGVGEYFEYWSFDPQRITELDWGEQVALGGGFTVYCRPARHFSGRTFRANRTLWASFVVETPSQRIFLGGDGGYDTHFADVAREFPNLDVAVLEDGQYSEDWRYIHMLPADLKRAVEDLGARRVFPVHNSKYALARHPWDEPLNNAAALAAENPEAGIVLPRIGEPVRLDRSDTLPGRWWTAPEN